MYFFHFLIAFVKSYTSLIYVFFFLLTNSHLVFEQFAVIETMIDGSIYRGAEAEISIHSLNLQDNQYSKSQI